MQIDVIFYSKLCSTIQCNLDELVSNAGNKLVLMEFYVPTCGHAMRITSALNDLAAEYPNVVFLKVNSEYRNVVFLIYFN